MTEDKTEELDAIGEALHGADTRRYAWMQAQGALKKVAEEASKKKEKAKEVYDKVVDTQDALVGDSQTKVDAAYEALVSYQTAKSEELGIELNVVPQLVGGSKSL